MAANATNCIEYAFEMRTTVLALDTFHEFAQITIDIPENVDRNFVSAYIVAGARVHDPGLSPDTGIRTVGIKLGAAGFSDSTYAEFAEPFGYHITDRVLADVTSYFNTNFGSGASQTCQVRVKWAEMPAINISAELVLYYEFNDTGQATRVKTVRIPIESNVGALPTSMAELGTNQVPALDTELPEASKSYKNIFFNLFANQHNGNSDPVQVGVELDSEGETQFGAVDNSLGAPAPCWTPFIWVRDDLTTNSAHAFKARCTVTNNYAHFGGWLTVTYTYDEATTTQVYQSAMVPVGDDPSMTLASPTGAYQRAQFVYSAIEPGTLTLKQSAIVATHSPDAATHDVLLRAGGQTARDYTTSGTGWQSCGMYSIVHRVDSGAAQGAGFALVRGENTLQFEWLNDTINSSRVGGNFGAVMILNYTSDKAARTAQHAHTVMLLTTDAFGGTYVDTLGTVALVQPDASAYNLGVGLRVFTHRRTGSIGIVIRAERQAGEGIGGGMAVVLARTGRSGTRNRLDEYVGDLTHLFNRHASDPRSLMDPTTSREWDFTNDAGTADHLQPVLMLTYHAITFSKARTTASYSGDGSGITVQTFRADTHEFIHETTTAIGGGYTVTWYDDTLSLYDVARQDATHVATSPAYTLAA